MELPERPSQPSPALAPARVRDAPQPAAPATLQTADGAIRVEVGDEPAPGDQR